MKIPSNGAEASSAPRLSPGALFLRFLRYGLRAWGGPVAQIDMIRRDLVERERWVGRERFNRVLAVYQALPGPEATELCVYFGMISGGRAGGIAAGLGFVLPGFVMMTALSALYAARALDSSVLAALFFGAQPAVLALFADGLIGIGRRALADRYLAALACFAVFAQLCDSPFWITLAAAGLGGVLMRAGKRAPALLAAGLICLGASVWAIDAEPADPPSHARYTAPTVAAAGVSGLRAGLLTFGGAYTAVPFVRQDAVGRNWLTDADFLDGLALSGLLPAPLIIFGTFVGYQAAGLAGALAMTAGIFLPAFFFTLAGHRVLEGIVDRPRMHGFLDGATAGAVGIAGAAWLKLAQQPLSDAAGALLCVGAFAMLRLLKFRLAAPAVLAACAATGLLIF